VIARTGLGVGFALLATFMPHGRASAQAPLTLEVRAGVLAPVAGSREGRDRGGRIAPAGSFGVLFAIERSSSRQLYLGFSQHRLDCTDDGCGGDGRYIATAWDLGMRFDLREGDPVPWLRLGLTFPRVERERPAPLDAEVSSLGVGIEAGVGVRVGLGGRLSLSPGVRFGAVDTGLPSGGTLRLRYLAADLGLVVGF
jgi:hypothetical protein